MTGRPGGVLDLVCPRVFVQQKHFSCSGPSDKSSPHRQHKEQPETALIPERPTGTGGEREERDRQTNKHTWGKEGEKKKRGASKISNFKGGKGAKNNNSKNVSGTSETKKNQTSEGAGKNNVSEKLFYPRL